jgi:hypothetical protein
VGSGLNLSFFTFKRYRVFFFFFFFFFFFLKINIYFSHHHWPFPPIMRTASDDLCASDAVTAARVVAEEFPGAPAYLELDTLGDLITDAIRAPLQPPVSSPAAAIGIEAYVDALTAARAPDTSSGGNNTATPVSPAGLIDHLPDLSVTTRAHLVGVMSSWSEVLDERIEASRIDEHVLRCRDRYRRCVCPLPPPYSFIY